MKWSTALNIKFIFPTLSSSQAFQSRKSTQIHRDKLRCSGTVWTCGFTSWPHLSVWKPSHGRKKGAHLKGGWFRNQNKTWKDISILVKKSISDNRNSLFPSFTTPLSVFQKTNVCRKILGPQGQLWIVMNRVWWRSGLRYVLHIEPKFFGSKIKKLQKRAKRLKLLEFFEKNEVII